MIDRARPGDSPTGGPTRRQILLFFVLAFIFLAAGIGLRDPWPADEPRFALVARDMVETGDWLFPRVGGELYQDKPPLFFWSIATALTLTGSLRIAFLLPSLLSAMGVLWLVYDLGARWWDRRTGLLASATLLATIQFVVQAKRAQIDMMLCFLATLAIYGLARHLRNGPSWGWYFVSFAAMGAGVITKGVGFLPVFMLIPFGYAARKSWPAATRSGNWRWAIGPIVMLVVIGCWLVPMLLSVSASGDPALEAYRDEILLKQTAGRYANPWHHIKPFWYFIVEVIPPLWLPLSIAIPWLVPRWWKAIRERDLRILLLVGWSILVLLFFSASPGKRGVYILIMLPAVALAAGPYVRELWSKRGIHRTAFVITLALTIVLLAAATLNVIAPPEEAVEQSLELGINLTIPLLMFAGGGALGLLLFRARRGVAGLVTTFAVIWLVVSVWLGPSINRARSGQQVVEKLETGIGPDRELGLVRWKEQFLLYLDRPITHFGHRRFDIEEEAKDAIGWLREDSDRLLLVDDAAHEKCFDGGEPIDEGHGTVWYLVDADDVMPQCIETGTVAVWRYPDRSGHQSQTQDEPARLH